MNCVPNPLLDYGEINIYNNADCVGFFKKYLFIYLVALGRRLSCGSLAP